ncbi:hypothetical protein PB1_16474 [Bacillus methanolicus PB1]|uniref:Uncharacterized protein n=1 Tax=Bacillus methanolicus PB1 TaxID=997296 RepID=I3DY49_BACMT|nr:hypothetical protein [Bacillus methanolicus]EIJ79170.1 hypothetical protein PB1_16474 [Bacillus methanolicus PB1]
MNKVAQFPLIKVAYNLLKSAEHKVFNVDLYNGLDAPILSIREKPEKIILDYIDETEGYEIDIHFKNSYIVATEKDFTFHVDKERDCVFFVSNNHENLYFMILIG